MFFIYCILQFKLKTFIDEVEENLNQLNSFWWRKRSYCHRKCINYSYKHNSFELHYAAVHKKVCQDSFESMSWDYRETASLWTNENSLLVFQKIVFVHLRQSSAALKTFWCCILLELKFIPKLVVSISRIFINSNVTMVQRVMPTFVLRSKKPMNLTQGCMTARKMFLCWLALWIYLCNDDLIDRDSAGPGSHYES